MRQRMLILGIVVIMLFSLTACQKEMQSTGSYIEEETAMASETQMEQNRDFLMEQIGTPESGTLGTAELLLEVGCGLIREITNLDDTGKCYIITVVDDMGQEYQFTMGYDGYPGYIKDGEGNFLYAPED